MADEAVVDDFDKAFGEAVTAAEAEVQTPKADTAPAASGEDTSTGATGEDTAPAATGEDTTPGATGGEPAPAKPAAPAPAAAPAAPAAAPAPAPAAAAPAEPKETEEQKKQREAFEATIAPYEFSEEEKTALEAMKKDFPNEYLVVEARLKQVDRTINERVYNSVRNVLQQVYGDFGPIASTQAELTEERHFNAVRAAHPDMDAVVDKIPAWIKTQPAYLQPAMQAVYDGGATKDVIELVATYKAAAGVTTPPAASPPATPAKPAVPSDAGDLAPVSGKRSAPVPKGTPDMNDFDGAFAEATARK